MSEELLQRMRVAYHGVPDPTEVPSVDAGLQRVAREVLLWAEEGKESSGDPHYETELSRDLFFGFWKARVWYIDEDGVRSYIGAPFGFFVKEEEVVRAATRIAQLHKSKNIVRLEV